MVRKVYSPQEYEVKEKKKLNIGRSPGFSYNIVLEEIEGSDNEKELE